MKRTCIVLLLFGMYQFSDGNLDVFIAEKEVKKVFHALSKDLYIVRDGKVAPLVRSPRLTSLIPVIHSRVDRLKINFRSTEKMIYMFSMESSDLKIMKTPTASIALKGSVPKSYKEFRIKFPCTGVKSGRVTMTIVLQFKNSKRQNIFDPPITIGLRRECKAQGEPNAVLPPHPPRDCNKRCDQTYMLRRFCVSDFAIRAKVEYQEFRVDRVLFNIKVTRKFKTGRVKIERRSSLEVRGLHIGCDCGSLKIGHVYLILGKEDRRSKVLFVDNYTAATEWKKEGRRIVKTHRKKNKCPRNG